MTKKSTDFIDPINGESKIKKVICKIIITSNSLECWLSCKDGSSLINLIIK